MYSLSEAGCVPKQSSFLMPRQTLSSKGSAFHGSLNQLYEEVSETKGRKDDRQVKKAKFAGKYVYSAGTDGVVRVWLSPSLDLLKEIPALGKEVADFDISTATRSGAPAILVASREECRVYRHNAWMVQPEPLATLSCSAPFKFRNCRYAKTRSINRRSQFTHSN